jgi:hypothetical protein
LETVDIRREFERLQDHVDSRILLLIFPSLVNFESYPLRHLHAEATSSVDGLDFDTIDLFDSFAPYDPEDLKVAPKDLTHPNAFANDIVTERITTYLERELEELNIF